MTEDTTAALRIMSIAELRVQLAYYCNPMQKWFTGPVTETSEVLFDVALVLEK